MWNFAPRRRLAASLILALALGAAVAVSNLAAAGEEATTWRAGDFVMYAGGCHDARSMIAVAKSPSKGELWGVLIDGARCFTLHRRIAARLEEWIDGPFRHDAPTNFVGSVWRVLDVAGDTEFIWLGDAGGPHPARLEMSL